MALTNEEKEVIPHFLKHYNEYHASAFAVTRWPDEEDRTNKAIDAIANDSAVSLGIEHTLLQPFSGEKQDSNVFMQTVGQLDMKPSLIVPGFDVDLALKVGAIPKGFDWSLVAPAVEAWYRASARSISQGQSEYTVPNLPISLTITITKVRSLGKGHFFVQRFMPAETVDAVVEQALKAKLFKLIAAPVNRRVLLLEKASIARGYAEIGDAVDTLKPTYPGLDKIDEIWVINTVALKSENYTASYLVWPPEEVQKFEEWRHAG